MHRSPHALDFSTARTQFLSGADDPRAYLERCIATIAARDPEIHAFVRRAENARCRRRSAERPAPPALRGRRLPNGVKDIMETAICRPDGNALYRDGRRTGTQLLHAIGSAARRGGKT